MRGCAADAAASARARAPTTADQLAKSVAAHKDSAEAMHETLERLKSENANYDARLDDYRGSLPLPWVGRRAGRSLVAGFVGGLWWLDAADTSPPWRVSHLLALAACARMSRQCATRAPSKHREQHRVPSTDRYVELHLPPVVHHARESRSRKPDRCSFTHLTPEAALPAVRRCHRERHQQHQRREADRDVRAACAMSSSTVLQVEPYVESQVRREVHAQIEEREQAEQPAQRDQPVQSRSHGASASPERDHQQVQTGLPAGRSEALRLRIRTERDRALRSRAPASTSSTNGARHAQKTTVLTRAGCACHSNEPANGVSSSG